MCDSPSRAVFVSLLSVSLSLTSCLYIRHEREREVLPSKDLGMNDPIS